MPKIIWYFLRGGIVLGSVSIIVAKKTRGKEVRVSAINSMPPNLLIIPDPTLKIKAGIIKEKNKVNLRTFLTINSPIIAVIGSMGGVATHQSAAEFAVNPSINAVIATGLKMCFLLTANTYLEIILISPARKSIIIPFIFSAGGIIKNKINPVIKLDSMLVTALSTRAMKRLLR